jgi:hypothetical protein
VRNVICLANTSKKKPSELPSRSAFPRPSERHQMYNFRLTSIQSVALKRLVVFDNQVSVNNCEKCDYCENDPRCFIDMDRPPYHFDTYVASPFKPSTRERSPSGFSSKYFLASTSIPFLSRAVTQFDPPATDGGIKNAR